MRKLLLLCGILSSLLYVATDVLGGLRYDGYSFASQAVSELMAVGAPSKSLVDPLFLIYDLLVVAFGVGVMREAAGRSRALRIAGALLVGFAVAGFTGPTLFPMHTRGTSSLGGDAPHILLTVVIVVLMLLAIGFGAVALGRRFRVYSIATIVTIIVFGAATAPFAARLAGGQPTPGIGIVERINIYASMLWIAMLAVCILRQERTRARNARPPARDLGAGVVTT